MLFGVVLGTNNLKEAGDFYDKVMAVIEMERSMEDAVEIGYGPKGGTRCFWVTKPFNKKSATFGNGTQVTFKASSNEMVDEFHRLALELGGENEGDPGYRYRPNYYGAYCRDLDGNKLHIMCEPAS